MNNSSSRYRCQKLSTSDLSRFIDNHELNYVSVPEGQLDPPKAVLDGLVYFKDDKPTSYYKV